MHHYGKHHQALHLLNKWDLSIFYKGGPVTAAVGKAFAALKAFCSHIHKIIHRESMKLQLEYLAF